MKIICIGRNYQEHAKEMGADIPQKPVFFMKPDTALMKENRFYYPSFTQDLHYECEIVVKISKTGKNIDELFAHKYYNEISLGIDFTARDLQGECKKNGLPWELAKSFDNSAPIAEKWLDISKVTLPIHFEFLQNNVLKQTSNSAEMLFSIEQIIAYVSKFITLKTGDLIYTGTPAGVGPVAIGDKLIGKIEGEQMFEFDVH
jgi:2-keto-4-pentenoate hydratase/2-oxohepta-3-ene-1,7-dioic acid hydratase in catechol pathway